MITREQKIKCYIEVRDTFQCLADITKVKRRDCRLNPISGICKEIWMWAYTNIEEDLLLSDEFPEIFSKEVKEKYKENANKFWFPLTEEGDIQRVLLLNEIINKL